MDPEISKTLQSQLQLLYETFSLDQGTLRITQELAVHFLSLLPGKPSDQQLAIVPRIAMWLGSKQQQIVAVDGSLVHGAGISLNSVIRDAHGKGSLEEIIELALLMAQDLRIDQSCIKLLTNTKATAQILTMFYKKLEGSLAWFSLADQHSLVKSITWSLFLIIKKNLAINDLVQSTCVLVSVLNIVINQLIHAHQPNQKPLADLRAKYPEQSDQMQKEILAFLVSQFKIKDLELFNITNVQSVKLYQDLLRQCVIKQLKTNYGQTIFVNSIINSNEYKLDQHYSRLLKFDDFDERIIIPERNRNFTPKKVTPQIKSMNIKQQQMHQKYEIQREPLQQTKYQKLLNYEIDQKINLSTNLREIRLPKNILMSPYAQQQVIATPMTEAMEMYNWIHEKQQPFKKYIKQGKLSLQAINEPHLFASIKPQQALIDQLFKDMVEYCEQSSIIEQNQSKKNLYWTLYLLMIEKQSQSIDEGLLKGILGFTIDCVNFILNKSSQLVDQIILKCQIPHFQIWKQLDFFLNNFDSKIPFQLKEHYLDIETKFVSYHIWTSDSQSELVSFLNDIHINRSNPNNTQMNRLFKRVLHYCAYQIQTIGTNLRTLEQHQEYVWITVKFIISEKTECLRHHSLDQIVLASFYAILKINGVQVKFQGIINSYEQTNSWYSKQFIKKIVCNVYINNDTMGDIVSYYNQAFIPQVKQFMLQMTQEIRNNQMGQIPYINKNPAIQNRILDSPLRDILPRSQQPATGMMTPSTQLLYAYQESPLLKQIQKQPSQKENLNLSNLQKIDYSNETQDFIQKKFEQLKTSKQQGQQKALGSKPSFSILAQGTPKIVQSTRNNNSFMHQVSNISGQSQTEGNSTFCKLLNFES